MIVNSILDAITTNLIATCQTPIAADDITRADVIKKGMFQENPTLKNVSLAVQGGDHEDPNYRDGIVSIEKMDDINFDIPPREIGGGVYWWRRGVVSVKCYFILEGLSENDAHQKAYQILGRAINGVETTPMPLPIDEFGEKASQIFVSSNTFYESGGPPSNYLFRGKIFWQVLTERNM